MRLRRARAWNRALTSAEIAAHYNSARRLRWLWLRFKAWRQRGLPF